MYTTYGEINIRPMDLDFIERVSRVLDVDYYEADIFLGKENIGPANIANQVICYVLTEGVLKHVEDEEDQEKLLDSIYLNCLDSGYNIDEKDLTEDGQAYLKLFNSY